MPKISAKTRAKIRAKMRAKKSASRQVIMTSKTTEFADLPASLKAERHGAVAVLRLNRAQKRNALDDPMVAGIETFFSTLPEDIRAVVLCGEGEHFSAGLDLTGLVDRATVAGIAHSRSWHRAFDRIEFGNAAGRRNR